MYESKGSFEMLTLVDAVITPLVTPERRDVILGCINTFTEIGYEAVLDDINECIGMQDGISDNAILLDRIDSVITIAQDAILRTHEITVSPQATTVQKQAIVEAVVNVGNYILPEQIKLLFNGEFDNTQILGQLVPMFGLESYDEIHPLIEDVSESFIERLIAQIEATLQVDQTTEDYIQPVSKVATLNRAFGTWGKDNFSIIVNLSNAGMRIGAEFDLLYNLTAVTVSELEVDKVILEIFGIAMFSNIPKSKIWVELDRMIVDYADGNHFYLNDLTKDLRKLKNIVTDWKEYLV